MNTLVVNLRRSGYDVYIGRPRAGEPWGFGNPFRVGPDGDREACIAKFDLWLDGHEFPDCPDATPERRDWIVANLHRLKGKRLGCFCAPKACHGDVLKQWVEDLI